jgi:hypothetical protein
MLPVYVDKQQIYREINCTGEKVKKEICKIIFQKVIWY